MDQKQDEPNLVTLREGLLTLGVKMAEDGAGQATVHERRVAADGALAIYARLSEEADIFEMRGKAVLAELDRRIDARVEAGIAAMTAPAAPPLAEPAPKGAPT